MGQRHQLFVIAKINGKYRTLCAIHHQWLYGHTALSRCHDILKIFGDAKNQTPIQQELRFASKKDENFWVATPDEQETRKIEVPFPFIATCLSLGASFNVDDGYYHGVRIEPFHMQYNEGDNNNGITIFDISDTSDVRYCFVDVYGMESTREVPLMTPLSARTYLQAYYDLDEIPLKPLLERFEAVKLIATHALSDTWPDGEWRQPEPNVEGAVGAPDMPELKMPHLALVDAPKTLRDQSMEKLLDALLEDCEDASQLVAEAEAMTDFMPKLRRKLYEDAATLQASPALLSLLCRVLEHETEVDLSPFKTLTTNDISAIVAGLRKGRMETLDLSDMSHLQESDLEQILGLGNAAPENNSSQVTSLSFAENPDGIKGLKTLILLENPQISLDFLAKHLGDCEVYHSELFRRSIGEGRWDSPYPSLEFVAPNIVSQLVWIGISESHCSNPIHRRDDGRFEWETLQYSKRAPHIVARPQEFGFEQYPIDIPLPNIKMTAGLLRLLTYLSTPRLNWHESWAPAAAACFAHVPTSGNMNGCSVTPLSFTLSGGRDELDFLNQINYNGPLKTGQWAIVLIHEGFDVRNWGTEEPPKFAGKEKIERGLRYVLAKALAEPGSSGKSYLITDVHTHLELVLGEKGENAAKIRRLSKWWENAISRIDGEVGYYEEDDIYEILDRVYSVDNAAVKEEQRTTTDVD